MATSPAARGAWRRSRLPAELLCRGLETGNGACALEARVVSGAALEQREPERDRIHLRGRGELVDEALGGEGDLRAVGVAQVAHADRRFPHERHRDDAAGHAAVGDGVFVRGVRGAAACRLRFPLPGELRDEHGIVLVVAHVVEVGRARVVVERHQLALRVECATHGDRVGGTFRVPPALFLAAPLHAHRAAELGGEKRRFEAGVVGRRASVRLRSLHPDDAHVLARDLQELRHAVASPYDFMSFE